MHYKQQPLNIRESEFDLIEINDSADLRKYLNWWNSKFPNMLDILYQVFAGVAVPSLSRFYQTRKTVNMLDPGQRAEFFRQILATFKIDSRNISTSFGGDRIPRIPRFPSFNSDGPVLVGSPGLVQGTQLMVKRNKKQNGIKLGKSISIEHGDTVSLEDNKDHVLVLLKVRNRIL